MFHRTRKPDFIKGGPGPSCPVEKEEFEQKPYSE